MKKYIPFVIVVLHVVGIFGLNSPWRDLFLQLTPVNLLITFIGGLWLFQSQINIKFVAAMLLAFAGGFGAEYIGVHTGFLFGDYSYGAGLGPRWEGIPLAIGMNWAMLILVSRSLANRLVSSCISQAIVATLIMVILDLFMEPVAPRLDFWEFDGGTAPFSNYFGWFAVALFLHVVSNYLDARKWDTKADVVIYTVQTAFFLTLILSA